MVFGERKSGVTDMEAKAREWGKELVAEGWEPKQVSIAVGAYAKGLREGVEEAAKERTLPYTDRQQARISVWEQAQDSMAAAIREKINDM